MKSSFKKLLLSSLMVLSVLALSCGDDDPPQDGETEILTRGPWSLANGGSIIWEGTDISEDYTGMTMTFTTGSGDTHTYNSTNAGTTEQTRLFRATGTWEWADTQTLTVIDFKESDKSLADVLLLTENTFRFRFTKADNAGGTAAGIDGLDGTYIITLTRE